MTKFRNKFLLVLLALCLVACMVLTVACGGNDEGDGNTDGNNEPATTTVTYTVNVKIGDNGVSGVKVTVSKGVAEYTPKTTDADGKVEFSLEEADGYSVWLEDMPVGYQVPTSATLTFSDRTLTINLVEKFAYKVKLVNPDGTPFTNENVKVGICTLKGNCLSAVEVDDKGVAKIYDADKTDYHIQVLDLPAGYAIESDGNYAVQKNKNGNYTESDGKQMVPVYVAFSDTVFEQKITVYPVNVIKLTDGAKLSDDDRANQYGYVVGMTAYKMDVEVAAKTTAYYEYTAEYSGDYYFYSVTQTNPQFLSYKLNESFLLGDSYLSGSGAFYPPITLEKGKTYYLNVTNSGEEKATIQLIMATPYASNVSASGAGTYKAEIYKQGKNAVIEFKPTVGTYKLTVNGNGAIKQANSSYMLDYVEFDEADYTNCKEIKVKYTEDMVDTLYFAVSVKGNAPASADVKITKVGSHTNTTTVVTNNALTQTPAPEQGKELAPVALGATVVKGDDGKYHLGDKNGPVVYVNLTEKISASRYNYDSQPLIAMELAANGYSAYVFDVTTDADKAADNKGKTYKDFRTVLRGFAEYKNGPSGFTPSDKTTEKYYANYVNVDGVYPLDDILKEYLELASAQLDCAWQFACYVYIDCVEPDAIVGTYETDDKVYVLTIEKFGGFIIEERDEMSTSKYEVGTWTKSVQGEYSFVCKDDYDIGSQLAYDDGNFVYTDDWGTTLTFETPADPIVATYKPDEENENQNDFVVNKDGTYSWGEEVSGTWVKNENDDYYTFYDASNQPLYTVELTEEKISLFNYGADLDDISVQPIAELSVEKIDDDDDDIAGEYKYTTGNGTVLTLTVDEWWTFAINDGQNEIGGAWVANPEAAWQYEFTVSGDEGDTTYAVYVNNGGLDFYILQMGEASFTPTYQFTPVAAQDAIVGEYQPAENSASEDDLIVNSDGTYGMGDVGGTWVKNENDPYYTFTETTTQEQTRYIVEFDEDNGFIGFYDIDADMDDFDNPPATQYAFNRKSGADPIVGRYQTDSMNPEQHILVILEENNTVNFDGVHGTWEKSADGTYYILTMSDDSTTKYIVEYDAEGESVVIFDYDESGAVDDNYKYELGALSGGPGRSSL